MDAEVQAYVDAIDPKRRPLFDRVDRLVREVHPEVDVAMAYKMPTYRLGDRSLHVGVWSHGLSLYGWDEERNAGFVERHPETSSGRGTIRLRPADLDAIPDDELRDFLRAALAS